MISIIIINFRQKAFLEKCIDSIYLNFKSYPFEVIVVNNSPEEKLFFNNIKYPDLKVIENTNKGYSHANNFGAGISKGEYLLFLNADTEIKSDFLMELINNFKDMNFGAAGLKLFNPDNTFQLSFWKENNFLNEIENKKEEEKFREKDTEYIKNKERLYSDIKEVDWVSGAAIFIRKDIFNKTGGFDEEYFLFYEDADICKRLKDRGLKVYFYPGSNIIHYKGENVNPAFQTDTYYFSKKSQLLYYKKHNNFVNKIMLRLYLFIKFSILYLMTFNKIYLRILKLTASVK